jgi:hypothetical protein
MNYQPPGPASKRDTSACLVLILAATLTVATNQPIEGNDSRSRSALFRRSATRGAACLQYGRKSCNIDFRRPSRHRVSAKPRWGPASRLQPLTQTSSQPAWLPLFDGTTLNGWEVANFGGEGEVIVEDGKIVMHFGQMLTGITYQGDFPVTDYEIQWEAMRVDGIDFFSGLTFPVGRTHCTLIAAGWAGAVVGLSSIDDKDASENESTTYMRFENGRWYHFRVRVTDDRIRVWIDDRSMIDQPLEDRRIETRPEVDLSRPLGIAAWQSRTALRGISYRRLE